MLSAVEKWRKRVEANLKVFRLASCILNPYLAANMIWTVTGEGKPYSMSKMQNHWRLFREA